MAKPRYSRQKERQWCRYYWLFAQAVRLKRAHRAVAKRVPDAPPFAQPQGRSGDPLWECAGMRPPSEATALARVHPRVAAENPELASDFAAMLLKIPDDRDMEWLKRAHQRLKMGDVVV